MGLFVNPIEIWKKIPFASGYEASNLGNIRRLAKKFLVKDKKRIYWRATKARPIKTTRYSTGYRIFTFSVGGKSGRESVHRTVWRTFRGKIPKGFEINHIDYDRENNALINLECVSHLRNIQHSSHRNPKYKKVSRETVLAIRKNTGTYAQIAGKFGLSPATIGEIKRFETHRGIKP